MPGFAKVVFAKIGSGNAVGGSGAAKSTEFTSSGNFIASSFFYT